MDVYNMFSMSEEGKPPKVPGADTAVSICRVGDTEYNVILRGVIEDSAAMYSDLLFLLMNATEDMTINIFITSPGGSVFVGMEISNAMMASKAKVNTIIAGLAASIAAVIWLSGKERYCLPYSLLMIHGSSHFDGGKSTIVAERANAFIKFSKLINYAAVKYGIITEEEFLKIVEDRIDLRIFGSELLKRCACWGKGQE